MCIRDSDRDIVFKSCFRAVNDTFENDVAVVLLHFARVADGTVEQSVRQGRRDRSAEERSALFEKPYHIVIELSAVLDGVYSVFQCGTRCV